MSNESVQGSSPSYTDESASENSSNQNNSNLDNSYDEKCDDAGGVGALKQGRKTFVFWTIFVVLLTLTVLNLMITLSIIGVLHLGKGIRGMELIPEENAIKFVGSTDLDRIYMKNSQQINGFNDVPLTIAADGAGSVHLRLVDSNGELYNSVIMDETGIQFRAINNFEIKDPESDETVFTTHQKHYNIPKGAEALLAKSLSASRITSPLDKSLVLEADESIDVKGAEGISIDGPNVLLLAEQNILINGTQTLLAAGAGIYLDMNKIPIANSAFGNVQYKICVCMPQGTLFRAHSCENFSDSDDPCGY